MFGMGLSELALIAVIAVLVFGPDRIPDLARQAGQVVRKMRGLATTARNELRDQLGPEYADLDFQDLDPRTFIRKQISEVMADLDEEEREKLRASAAEEPARALRPGNRPLSGGELPPYDDDAT